MEKFSFESGDPKKERKDKAVSSIRGRFAKAITAFLAPAIISGTLGNPDLIAFSKKDVRELLKGGPKISEYIENSDKAAKEGEMDAKERKKLFKMAKQEKFLEKKLGRNYLDRYFGKAGEDEKAREKFRDKVVMHPNVPKEDARRIGIDTRPINMVLDSMPHSWVESIEQIRFINEIKEAPKHYGLKGREVAAQADRKNGNISYFKNSYNQTGYGAVSVLTHEMAHLNDWVNPRRPMPERVDLMYRTLNRVNSEDRYRSGYVEAISNKDKRLELFIKTAEYWAEIVKARTVDLRNLPIKDRELVDDYLDRETAQDVPELKKPARGKTPPLRIVKGEY